MIKQIWNLLNKNITYEQIVHFNSLLTVAKDSQRIINKNIDEIKRGENSNGKYSDIFSKYQNFLSPFGGKDYRSDLYLDLETNMEIFKKLKKAIFSEVGKVVSEDLKISLKDDFQWVNEKEFIFEGIFQFLYVLFYFRNKSNVNKEIEILTKAARRANYDLAHLSYSRLDSIHFYEVDGFTHLFCVKGPSTQIENINKYSDYLYKKNTVLSEFCIKNKIKHDAEIIPF